METLELKIQLQKLKKKTLRRNIQLQERGLVNSKRTLN